MNIPLVLKKIQKNFPIIKFFERGSYNYALLPDNYKIMKFKNKNNYQFLFQGSPIFEISSEMLISHRTTYIFIRYIDLLDDDNFFNASIMDELHGFTKDDCIRIDEIFKYLSTL